MKLSELIAVAIGTAPLASAFSLYDTAPMVGVPESQAARYYVTMRGGYDTNPQGTTNKRERKGGFFANASVSSTFADVESVDQLSYTVRLGGTKYFGTSQGGGRKYYGDCNTDVTFAHAFSAMSRYTGRLHISYMPEPGYDNGFSSAGMQGDTLSWNLDNNYAEAIDARWSWNAGASLSGTKYEEKTYSTDDRQYYSASLGLNYRESDRLTYTSSVSCRHEPRAHGMDSQSAFGVLGIQYALDPVSSLTVDAGAQCKRMNHRNTYNPTLNLGYRRRVADGLSINWYVKYSDENVDNYNRLSNASYRTSATWRVGAYGTYVLSPDVSYVLQMQLMRTDYRKPTRRDLETASRYSVKPSLSMNYNFTPEVMGTVTLEYTFYHYERGSNATMYNRWQFSSGLSYRF